MKISILSVILTVQVFYSGMWLVTITSVQLQNCSIAAGSSVERDCFGGLLSDIKSVVQTRKLKLREVKENLYDVAKCPVS